MFFKSKFAINHLLLYNKFMREITFKIEEKQDGLMIRDFLRNFGVSSALLTKLKQDEKRNKPKR